MYEIWVFLTATGAKTAYLENAFNIQRIEKINQTPTLSFSFPNDTDNTTKAAYLTSAYDVKIYNTKKSRWEGLFLLDDATEKWDASGSIIECNYSGAMVQLAEEENVTYDTGATPHTPTTIITELLAKQEHVPAITVGTIQPTTTFAFAIENANLLEAILKCVDYLGGRIEVDSSRALNWYTDPVLTTPVREIRYKKNMKGVTRKRDFTSIRNKVYAYGDGETEAQVNLIDAGETYEYIESVPSQTSYGIKIKRITDKRIIHPSTLLRWAQLYLATYKDPIYYYTVDVVNLAEHSDFDFDYEELTIGQVVRVVNSDLNNLSVNVKLCSITTNLSRPEEITVELANVTKDISDSFRDVRSYTDLAQNVAVTIGAGQVIVQGTFTVDGWRSAGQTTIDGGQITTNTITADAIKTSTLNAKTITLGTTGGDSTIKSGNYVADTTGWQIKANGDAEFNNVKVRGTIYTASIASGSVLTVTGTIQSSNFIYNTSGWRLMGGGQFDVFDLGAVSSIFSRSSIFTMAGGYMSSQRYVLQSDPIGYFGDLHMSADGLHLYFKDKNNLDHLLI